MAVERHVLRGWVSAFIGIATAACGNAGPHAGGTETEATGNATVSMSAGSSGAEQGSTQDSDTTSGEGTSSTTTTTGGGVDETTGGVQPPTMWTPDLENYELHCKLISDEHVDDPSANQTHTRFNLRGTDLGIPLTIGDVLHLFFGDTQGYREIWAVGEDPDSVGFADAPAVEADPTVLCSELAFYVTPDIPSVANDVDPTIERDFAAGWMAPPPGEDISAYITNHPGSFPNIPGSFEVPSGALMVGEDVYLLWAGKSEFRPQTRMTLSYLARWDPPRDLPTYQIVRPIDSVYGGDLGGHFIQILPFVVDDMVYLLGTGQYRHSGVYLARVPVAELETGAEQEVYDPESGQWLDPSTLTFEQRAAISPMLETDGVGELGGVFVAGPDLYVLTYQRELHGPGGGIVDNRIVLRTAPHPSGPWSEAVTIIDMADPAFVGEHCCGATCVGSQILHCASAGLYGAYPLPHPTVTPGERGTLSLGLPFLTSTWNPYNVVLFEAHVTLHPGRLAR